MSEGHTQTSKIPDLYQRVLALQPDPKIAKSYNPRISDRRLLSTPWECPDVPPISCAMLGSIPARQSAKPSETL